MISAIAALAIGSIAFSALVNKNADAQVGPGKITACLQVNTTAFAHSSGHSINAISPVC